ncbi:hypothetical protein WJX75_001006 [Coccomyxa subellipsoidea]|uniref:THO complex subunit 2 n=1 Tax=Coccomyxa subellipsoidea TaxID=248742 RepID=A0ABR2YZH1_9CHLO
MGIDEGSTFSHHSGEFATLQILEGLNEGKVLASEIGATVTGINAANFRQYLLELAHAVAAGKLLPAKYAVGMKASGIPVDEETPLLLAEILWVAWVEVQGEGNAAAQALIADLTKELLKEQLVSKDVLMMNMDGEFLEEVGAVTKAAGLRKKEVQLNTRMHYTQRRFNLLREESEGYAKLITALCQSGSATPVDHLVTEVKALIGFFDLDPNRVYDVVLEAFESAPGNAALLALAPLFSAEARTQILGFKFQRLAADGVPAPEALFNIAAQLIKAELVPLEGLLPHLAPPDAEALESLQSARKKLAEEVAKIGIVSLTQAAAEKDEAARSKVGLTAAKMELDARALSTEILAPALATNHKLGLAAGLLQVDDWTNASKLLNLLSGLKLDPVAFPPISRALCGMLHSRLQPSFDALYPDGPRGLCILNRKNAKDVEVPPPGDDTVGLLLLLGAHAHADLTLLSQLARILTHALLRSGFLLSSPPTIAEGRRRIALVKLLLSEVLLPALCMVPSNVGLVNDVWGVLHYLDYHERWAIYNAHKAKVAGSPLLAAAGKLAVTETRKVMRRVHVPDLKMDKRERKKMLAPFARLLAKAAHANPLPVCDHIVGHVEAYSVMTEPILDAMRFFTPFGFDVLSFVLVDRLASGRDKLKADGLNISDWLQALSQFVGQACRRYERMDTSAICQYLANTLKAAQSFDLLVLKALVSDMTGIAPVSDLSAEQVEALAGGPLLQQEVINLGASQTPAKALSKTSKWLVAALQNDKLLLPLYVMLAQQRRYIAVSTDSPHLKLIAELYDKCQETLFLYTEFLSTALPPAERAALLPSISELVLQYGVDFEVAFQAHRPLIRDLSPPVVPPVLPGTAQENGDTAMEEVEDGELEDEKLPLQPHAPAHLPNGLDAAGGRDGEAAGPGPGSMSWQELVDDVHGTLPGEVWRVMSPEFYISFWSLSYQDIFVPADRYKRESTRLKDMQTAKAAELRSKEMLMDQARDQRPAGGGYGGMGGGYRGNNEPQIDVDELRDDITSLKELLKRVEDSLKRLPEELRAQEANAARVDTFLTQARPHWGCDRKGMLYAYLQQCILPRVTYSPPDAAFCAKFTQRLHELAVPFFPTILYFDTMMRQMVSLVFSCTDREALNLAIFLNETFILLERWRGSESVYARECAARPGFSMSFSDPGASRTSFGDYRRLCAKWQHTITGGLRAALQSKNYVQTRNAFLILNTTVKARAGSSFSRLSAVLPGVARGASWPS